MALQFPSQTYWDITHIADDILICCELKSIIVWPEYGTLLGMKRHGGSTIPWSQRGFFGMFVDDRDRFIETFMKMKSNDLVIDIGYYCDNGCLAIYTTENPIHLVNIIFYEKTNDSIKTLQNSITRDQIPNIIGNCYQYNNFMPPTKTLMLGHNVYVPNYYESILESWYGNWREYPYEYRDYIIDRFSMSPYKEIDYPQCLDFNDFRSLIENMVNPFVLKESTLLTCSVEQYQDIIDAQQTEIQYLNQHLEPAIMVWQRFLENSLIYDLTDSTVDDKTILTPEWLEYYHEKYGMDETNALLWKITNKPNESQFNSHVSMGSFIKILSGEKIFWIISSMDYQYLLERGFNSDFLSGLRMCQLLKLAHGYLFGRIMVSHLSNGDLLYLPPNYLWKEITIENTYGFGGYL